MCSLLVIGCESLPPWVCSAAVQLWCQRWVCDISRTCGVIVFFCLFYRQRLVLQRPEAASRKSSPLQRMPALRTRPLITWLTVPRGHVRCASMQPHTSASVMFQNTFILPCVKMQKSLICDEGATHRWSPPCHPKCLNLIEKPFGCLVRTKFDLNSLTLWTFILKGQVTGICFYWGTSPHRMNQPVL